MRKKPKVDKKLYLCPRCNKKWIKTRMTMCTKCSIAVLASMGTKK